MVRSYTAMTTLIRDVLQTASTASADGYTVGEIDRQIERSLEEISTTRPHLVPIVFKIEGRYGNATSTSTDNLVDTTKGHFKAADSADEKVIHNTFDDKRSVIISFSSTSQVGIAPDIMEQNEHYDIYNKQCWNHRQIYIGDVPEFEKVHSVEYPIGTKRNFTRYDRVLEIDVIRIPDTNANTAVVNNLPNEDVLVRFNMPHQLSQLTDVSAVVASSAAAAATIISGSAFQAAGTIEVGSEFNIENHRTTYIIKSQTTISANTASISFYPPLEVVANTATILTFRESSLEPDLEDIFVQHATGRLAINKSPKYFNAIALGGGVVYQHFLIWGKDQEEAALRKLRQSPPKVKQTYPRD